jgi:hypothetical protein
LCRLSLGSDLLIEGESSPALKDAPSLFGRSAEKPDKKLEKKWAETVDVHVVAHVSTLLFRGGKLTDRHPNYCYGSWMERGDPEVAGRKVGD